MIRFLFPLSLAGAAFLAEPVWGGEYALFSGGGRLRVDRHEAAGSTITLYLGAGTIELAAAEIRGFEPDERVAPPPIIAAPPSAPEPAPFPEQLADAAANKYGLPADLVRSVMKAESSLHSNVVSPKGAIGLMQLMPGTAQALGVDPHDPAQNVEAGTRYLRALLEKYGGALRHALAAYNAGPGAVGKYGGVPPFAETVEYIRRVERQWKRGE